MTKTQLKTATLVKRKRFHRWVLALQAVDQGISQAQLARETKQPKYTVSRTYKDLLMRKLIRIKVKSKPIFYALTSEGRQLLGVFRRGLKTATLKPLFRYHRLFFISKLRHTPPRFQTFLKGKPEADEELEKLMTKTGFVFSQRRHFGGWQKKTSKATVFITSESVWFLLKPIWASSEAEALNEAIEVAMGLRVGVEAKFKCRLGTPEQPLDLRRQEIAMLGGLTEFFPKGYFKQGERIAIDSSTGKPEIEAVHKEHALEDMDRIYSFQDAVARGEITTEAVKAALQALPIVAELGETLRKPRALQERRDIT